MESRTDLVRLLEEMDKVLDTKRRELAELDEQLDVARDKVSQKEASEIQQQQQQLEGNEQAQASSSSGAANQDQEDIKKFIEKQKSMYDQQLAEFAEQLSELESINQKMRDENHRLTLREAHKVETDQQMESAYYTLSDHYQELYKENSRLRLELAQAEAKSTEQQSQLDKSNQLDKVLEDLYNKKLDSLNKIIELKDEEIEQLKADNQFTLESLGITTMDQAGSMDYNQMSESEPIDMDRRQRVIQIAATIREKDSQIESLKSQLLEATKELEKSASLLESITNQSYRTRDVDTENQLSLTQQLNELNNRCDQLERELCFKDQRITDLERRNLELTFLVPEKVEEILHALSLKVNSTSQGNNDLIEKLCSQLSSLLNELRTAQEFIKKNEELKVELGSKDHQIMQLVGDLNQLDTQFNLAVRGVKPGLSEDEHKLSQRSCETNFSDYKSTVDRGEMVNLSQEMDTPMCETVTDGETTHTDEIRVDEKDGPDAVPDSTITSHAPSKFYVSEKVDIDTVVSLQRRLRLLEDENELLELAMKEILLCIRWSDSQCSTLLIDCPSLERLCQIIEARYIAGSNRLPSGIDIQTRVKQVQTGVNMPEDATSPDTFQLVLLKSELDLVRGQNEQLRSDIKTLRRDYQELLSNGADTAALHSTNYLSMKFAGKLTNVGNLEFHQKKKDTNGVVDSSVKPDAREVECQTELTLDSVSDLVERVQSPSRSSEPRSCLSCKRSSETINYLIQSIARLETRVSISDDNYMTRFKHWNQLIQMLSRDLSESTESLKGVRKECHILRQQKYKAESKLEIIEHQVVNHLKSCPNSRSLISETTQNIKTRTTSDNSQEKSIQSLAICSGSKSLIELPTTSARVIITLLKSIVGCLQARLVFKDERIRQLESLIVQIKFCADPA